MQQLPYAKTYRLEMQFMPWGKLIGEVVQRVVGSVRFGGSVMDLMCGPGYLLEEIFKRRPDLNLFGVDLDSRYVAYASKKNPRIQYFQKDVRTLHLNAQYDCVLCTGSLHHLPYSDQPGLFEKMNLLLKTGGFCICADPCVGEYVNEKERQLAAVKLGYEYLKAVIESGAPSSIVSAAADILRNDVLADGEYKVSLTRLIEMAKVHFSQIEVNQTWPKISASYGDYWLVLS